MRQLIVDFSSFILHPFPSTLDDYAYGLTTHVGHFYVFNTVRATNMTSYKPLQQI